MKTLEEIKHILLLQKPMLIEKHQVKEIGIFGSYVRGEHHDTSDVDILIDFEEYPGLFEFVEIEQTLGEHLGITVDLVMKSGLKPTIGTHILQEVIYV